jgi:hypothetical protein
MKINTNTSKIFCAALIVAGITLNTISCKKNSESSNTTATTTVTEADAAQFTSDAVSPSSGGMANQLSGSTSLYATTALSCGVQKDSTISILSQSGVTPVYSYTFAWKYMLNCNGNVPTNITFNFTGKGSYNGALMSASDTSNAQFVLTGSSSAYLLTANYTRTGNATSKIARQYTFHTVLNIQSSNIAINKTTHEITSGTATVTLVATSTSGKKFTFGGTLTFLGNKKGSLVLNSGVVYTIQWL